MIDALLIYPKLGFFDNIACDIPLSILYAASAAVKTGYRLKALDFRNIRDWKTELRNMLKERK